MTRRKLVSSSEKEPCWGGQHTSPCGDCPWRRDSLPGWLGGSTAEQWHQTGHSDGVVLCHTIENAQCAGIAIYRANVVKRVDPPNLKLPKNLELVFGYGEFIKHHEKPFK